MKELKGFGIGSQVLRLELIFGMGLLLVDPQVVYIAIGIPMSPINQEMKIMHILLITLLEFLVLGMIYQMQVELGHTKLKAIL